MRVTLNDIGKYYKISEKINTNGGRTYAIKILKKSMDFSDYEKNRNDMTMNTTLLSSYIKFGCVSIREVWKYFGNVPGKSGKELQRQLIWREFYYQMYIDFPDKLEWDKSVNEATSDARLITLLAVSRITI